MMPHSDLGSGTTSSTAQVLSCYLRLKPRGSPVCTAIAFDSAMSFSGTDRLYCATPQALFAPLSRPRYYCLHYYYCYCARYCATPSLRHLRY
eukprot:179523-Rhodomonas_salina.2